MYARITVKQKQKTGNMIVKYNGVALLKKISKPKFCVSATLTTSCYLVWVE